MTFKLPDLKGENTIMNDLYIINWSGLSFFLTVALTGWTNTRMSILRHAYVNSLTVNG